MEREDRARDRGAHFPALARGVLAVYARTGVCEGDAVRAAERVGREPVLRSLSLVGVSHPGYVHLHRDVVVTGDGRNDVACSLDALDAVASERRAGRFAITRGDEAERGLRARGWTLRYRDGAVAVGARFAARGGLGALLASELHGGADHAQRPRATR